jgi:hypothetical protein
MTRLSLTLTPVIIIGVAILLAILNLATPASSGRSPSIWSGVLRASSRWATPPSSPWAAIAWACI